MVANCKFCNRKYNPIRSNGHRSTVCNTCLTNKRRVRIKQKIVALKGSCCQRCGYNKCISALDFHHLDASKKEFGLNIAHTKKWELVEKEINKCELICSNCHREEHFKDHPKEFLESTIHIIEHGTYGKYRKGCRCSECKLANSLKMKKYRGK